MLRTKTLAACAALGAVAFLPCLARAQTVIQIDGAVNLNYSVTTPAAANDRGLTTQVSPGVTFQTGSPRLVFRAGYSFAADFNLAGSGSSSYFNRLLLELAAQTASTSTLGMSALVTQGSASFQLSQRPADTGQPAIRAPGNPDQITATVEQSYSATPRPSMKLSEALSASLVAPQYSLDRANKLASVSFGFDAVGLRDAVGVGLGSSLAVLQPLEGPVDPFTGLSTSIVARWSRDLGTRWSGQVSGGISHVLQLSGNRASAFVPTGSIAASYLASDIGRSGGSISVAYGPSFDLQTGTLTQSGSITARGVVNFGSSSVLTRQLAFSAGYLHSFAVNEIAALNPSGLGQAVQGDVGMNWGLSAAFLATLRASFAYQFGQPGGLPPSTVYVLLAGITGRYSNSNFLSPVPRSGGRVDGADGAGFSGTGSR